MNPSIHFPEREEWSAERQAIVFAVLVQGTGLTCAIRSEALYARYGEGEAMALFSAHRWELEEEAEKLIHDDEIDDHGWIWLS